VLRDDGLAAEFRGEGTLLIDGVVVLINSCGQILIVCIKVCGENSIKLISASSLT